MDVLRKRTPGDEDTVSEGQSEDKAPEKATTSSAAERAERARSLVEQSRSRQRGQDERRQKERARDAILVDKAKAGDTDAFQQLVRFHQNRLFAVAFGMMKDRDDAMDVVQDAFIKAHRKLVDFEGNAAFSTWLYRIAVNLCIDKKRAETRRRKTDLDDAATRNLDDDPLYAEAEFAPRLAGANPLKNAGNKELGAQIGMAMATLTEEHRAVVLLREVEGLSYEEISEALEIPKGTVMSRLFHARKNLQKALRPILGLEDGVGLDGKSVEDNGSDGKNAGKSSGGSGNETPDPKNVKRTSEGNSPSERLPEKAPSRAV